MTMHAGLCYLIICTLTVTSLAQVGEIGAGGSENRCKCTPSCTTVSSSECNGRILPRSDCPCCNVCLRQKGESCQGFNAPCEKGLTCSHSGICEAERSCLRDVECPVDKFCIQNICADPCPLLQPCLQSSLRGGICVTRNHVAKCDCPQNHKIDRDLNVCVPLQGCYNNGKVLKYGELFYKDHCAGVCFCGDDGFIRCQPIYCPNGLFPTGSAAKEDLCIELHVPQKTDDCCVIQACMNKRDNFGKQSRNRLTRRGKSLQESSPVAIQSAKPDRILTKRAAMAQTLADLQVELTNQQTKAGEMADQHGTLINDDDKGKMPLTDINVKENGTIVKEGIKTDTNFENEAVKVDELVGNQDGNGNVSVNNEDAITNGFVDNENTKANEPVDNENAKADGRSANGDVINAELLDSNVEKQIETSQLAPQFTIRILPRNSNLQQLIENSTIKNIDENEQASRSRSLDSLNGEIKNVNIGNFTVIHSAPNNSRAGKANIASAFETNEEDPALATLTKNRKKSLQLPKTNHNSSVVILPTTSGGVLHYKASKSGSDSSRLTAKSGQTRLLIEGLKPSTRYTLKWAGKDGSDDKIEIKTEDGCLHKLNSYGVGSQWNDGCAQKCECRTGGDMKCQQRCIFVKGSIQDTQCTEITSSSDPECCVEYACKNSSTQKVVDIPKTSKTMLATVEGKLIVTSRTDDSITVAWENFREINPDEGYVAEYRKSEPETGTWMQQEVPQGPLPPTMAIRDLEPNTVYQVRVVLYKNTEEKLQVAKTETITVETQKIDPCMNKNCGQNAHCEAPLILGELGNCTCDDGFYMDSNTSSCELDKDYTSNQNGCRFQGKDYSPGDDFYDGCMFKCTCDQHREIDCQPRCQYSTDSKDTKDCLFFTDPEDKCCKLRVCNSTLTSPHNSLQSSLDSDGCLYGSKSYKKNENFTIGCELKCLCMGYGDVSCYPRCPPVNKLPTEGVNCTTLEDPLDTCCTVRICDNSTSEVLKDPDEIILEEELKMAAAVGDYEETTSNVADTSQNETITETVTNEQSMSSITEQSNITSSMESATSLEAGATTLESNATAKELHSSGEPSTSMSTKQDASTVANTTDSRPILFPDLSDGNVTEEINTTNELTSTNEISTTSEVSPTTNMPLLPIENDNETNISENENNKTTELMQSVTVPLNVSLSNISSPMTQTPNETSQSTARSSPSLILSNSNMTSESQNTTTPTVSSNTINEKNKSTHDRKLRLEVEDMLVPHLDILDVHKRDVETIEIKVKVSQDIMAELLSFAKDPIVVSYSQDLSTWKNQSILIGGIDILSVNTISFSVPILNGAVPNMLRIYYKNASSPIKISNTSGVTDAMHTPKTDFLKSGNMCKYKGKTYKIEEEFYDACENYCTCTENGEVFCAKIECPHEFGLDLMDPGCLEWKEDKEYVPTPPRCCRRKPRCILRIEDFACTIDGHTFDHLDVIPLQYSKCDQRCQCMKGHIDCENLCSPVQATPPFDLPCHPTEATIEKYDGYPCCPEWRCANNSTVSVYPPLPSGITRPQLPMRPPQVTQTILVPIVLDTSSDTVQFSFKIPSQFVGLPGGIYLRYTPSSSAQTNPLDWQSEVIHEDGLTLSGSDWVYQKKDLYPDISYSMQVVLSSSLAKAEIVSPIFSVKTLGIATSPLPRLELNAALKIGEVKNISAKITWRQFTDYELQYIDGIGVRYWPDGKKFPLEGPMLHRKSDSFMLMDLKPDTGYTVDLIFLTHDGYSTNIFNTHNMTFKTLPKPKDKYAFNITIKMGNITKKGVQILYSGVTEPEGIYVNVFRVVYTTDGDLRDSHKFKVPKNQKEGFIMLTDLKPGIAYEVWLEAYLTNGVKKKSNVITIHTNPAELSKPGSIIDAEENVEEGSHYYAALVWVSVLAALACIAFMLLLLYIWRRQNHAKAQISSKASYDNPSYKGTGVGYGIEMNGMKSNGNGRDES